MRKKEAKPLSFSTTMRNPYRIVKFLAVIQKYDNQLLTSELIKEIVQDIIKEKLYKPIIINNVVELQEKYNNDDLVFTAKELDFIYNNSVQKHKEAGFPSGWASRFDTWYKLAKELGFIYYQFNQKIELSVTANLLIDCSSSTQLQNIFLNSLAKYQSNNPFRRNLNHISPIPLTINVLKYLGKKNAKMMLHRKEIPFILCYGNNDYKKLSNYILDFRAKYHFQASDEIIYQSCLELLNSQNQKRFKFQQITRESVDDFIRKLSITGLFSLKEMGKFISINNLRLEDANYISKKYSSTVNFDHEYQFYQYMSSLDTKIFSFIDLIDKSEIKNKSFKNFTQFYTYDKIYKELLNLTYKKKCNDQYLKLIDNPIRLEFLIAILLAKKFTNYQVQANYKIDDEGNPTYFATGGTPDIQISGKVNGESFNCLVEVSLLQNSSQCVVEIPSICDHLEQRQVSNQKVFSIFIAPRIHRRSKLFIKFLRMEEKLNIYPLTIEEFIEKIDKGNNIFDLIN